MELSRLRSLNPELRALVAVAVLLDGQDGAKYLENDSVHGKNLMKAAEELAKLNIEVRMPLAGSLLRAAVKELEES